MIGGLEHSKREQRHVPIRVEPEPRRLLLLVLVREPCQEIWQAYDPMEARLTAPLSERMLELARVGPGMRVLDTNTKKLKHDPAVAQTFCPRPPDGENLLDSGADS